MQYFRNIKEFYDTYKSDDEKWKIVHLEIKYQRDVLHADRVCSPKLFDCKYLDRTGGVDKFVKYPYDVRVKNLKEI